MGDYNEEEQGKTEKEHVFAREKEDEEYKADHLNTYLENLSLTPETLDSNEIILKNLSIPGDPDSNKWTTSKEATNEYSPVYISPQDALAELDKISSLPVLRICHGQSECWQGTFLLFRRVTYQFFYKTIGPGCSSMIGAMSELGPFRINSDEKTLFMNDYAWSKVLCAFANMLFLESPAGVGFSYSNTTSDYDKSGDKNTADDAYIFHVNWLERFPQYKTRDFYIAGESYAGHYVPQLAYTIVLNNKKTNQTIINIKGIAEMRNFDHDTHVKGKFDYWWSHAIISDATHAAIHKYCDFPSGSSSPMCDNITDKAWNEIGDIDVYNIYAPICLTPHERNTSTTPGSINSFDPCWQYILEFYLNDSVVQKALHAKPTSWDLCSDVITSWNDRAVTILPIIKYLIVIFYVGGYLEAYKGLLLITVRGAGHTVPSYQPQCALALFTSFLGGTLPPSSQT
ncbi:hypothetical protein L1987_27119 [Smallanthus sonchifolius]|uniref:Uncharacterized protein n=1 Tax=Smallanthus sonchifolius TaxID=185202 RepID=A0ACB9IAQ3_9ASTR|nr:hypothetical protein L1987_27119 [Smallanthus sonchifolius]